MAVAEIHRHRFTVEEVGLRLPVDEIFGGQS